MRVTSNTFPDSLMGNLGKLSTQQAKLQQHLSTGQRITDPSDDPAAMGRILDIQSEKRSIGQFQRNISRLQSLDNYLYDAVSQMQESTLKASELATKTNELAGGDSFNAYATEVDALIENVLDVANSKYLDDFVFSGEAFDSAPFTATRDPDGKITSVAYGGTATSPEVYISEETKMSPYLSGTEHQEMADMINNLVALRDAMEAEDSSAVTTAQANLIADEDNMVRTMGELSSNLLRLQNAENSERRRFQDLDARISKEADVDFAQTIVQLTQAQNAYQAALTTGGRILNQSLLNYI